MQKKWKGYSKDFEGSEKLVFCLKEPNNSCFFKKMPIKISIESNHDYKNHKNFQISGHFPDRACSIIDSNGNVVAKVKYEVYFCFLRRFFSRTSKVLSKITFHIMSQWVCYCWFFQELEKTNMEAGKVVSLTTIYYLLHCSIA